MFKFLTPLAATLMGAVLPVAQHNPAGDTSTPVVSAQADTRITGLEQQVAADRQDRVHSETELRETESSKSRWQTAALLMGTGPSSY